MMDGEPVRLMPDPPVRGLTLYRIRPSGGRVFAKQRVLLRLGPIRTTVRCGPEFSFGMVMNMERLGCFGSPSHTWSVCLRDACSDCA